MKAIVKTVVNLPKGFPNAQYRNCGRLKREFIPPDSLKGKIVICKSMKSTLTFNKEYKILEHYCFLHKHEVSSNKEKTVVQFVWEWKEYIEIKTDNGNLEILKLSRFRVK